MSAGTIKFRELSGLPFPTLKAFALAVADEIHKGAEDKRELLERIFSAIRTEPKGKP